MKKQELSSVSDDSQHDWTKVLFEVIIKILGAADVLRRGTRNDELQSLAHDHHDRHVHPTERHDLR